MSERQGLEYRYRKSFALPEVFVLWGSLQSHEPRLLPWLESNGFNLELELQDGVWSEGPYGVELWPSFHIFRKSKKFRRDFWNISIGFGSKHKPKMALWLPPYAHPKMTPFICRQREKSRFGRLTASPSLQNSPIWIAVVPLRLLFGMEAGLGRSLKLLEMLLRSVPEPQRGRDFNEASFARKV